MDIQGLIFDCDGTLTDSMPLHFVAWQQVMSGHGIEFDEERFYALGGMPTDKIITMLAAEKGITLDVPHVSRQKEQAFIDYMHMLVEIPFVTEVVRREKGRKRMAVASGGFRHVIEMQIKQIGLEGWFDTIVCAEDTERHKPEPDVFLEAARRLKVPAENCLVYEDSELGIEAARRAGMPWVDVREFHQPARQTKRS